MRIAFQYLLLLFFAVLPFAGARAEDAVLNVTPGNYQIKRHVSFSNDPNAVVDGGEKCIKEKVYNPVESLPSDAGCTASNIKKNGSTVTFDINCTGGPERTPLTGKAEYSSNGMAISWNIVLNGVVEGKPVTTIVKAEGKRVGDCK